MAIPSSYPIAERACRNRLSLHNSALVEGIGSFVLVSTAGVAVFSACPMVFLGAGLAVMIVIAAGGHCTGGHLNAGITLAALLRRRVGLRTAASRWLAQLIGGVLGAAAVRAVVDADRIVTRAAIPFADSAIATGLLAELTVAFLLSYAVLGLTMGQNPASTGRSDLAVGVGAVVGAIGVATMSAVAFSGVTVLRHGEGGLLSWSMVWVYLVSHIIAGLVTGIAFLAFGWWAHSEDL
jgi:glycerol uptake facilitator-like aquaporin